MEIVRHADTCLVFADPPPPHGLAWRQTVAWWTKKHQPDSDEKSAVIGEAINGPGGCFGRNLDALADCLSGGFGRPDDDDCVVEWRDHQVSREHLGHPETVRQLEIRMSRCHPWCAGWSCRRRCRPGRGMRCRCRRDRPSVGADTDERRRRGQRDSGSGSGSGRGSGSGSRQRLSTALGNTWRSQRPKCQGEVATLVLQMPCEVGPGSASLV